MTVLAAALAVILCASLALNYRLYRKPPKARPTIEAAEMLRQVLSERGAVMHIRVIDQDAIMMRSPREYGR